MRAPFRGKFKVTSPRGYRTLSGVREYHGGLDLVAIGEDKSVYAIAEGVAEAVPYEANGFGYYVRQRLSDGRRVYYAHMEKGSVCVKAGDMLKVGDKLGVMGSTGRSTGAHCHIELRVPGTSKESLDISELTGIPNEVGSYCTDNAELIKERCGLEDKTIDFLKSYKFADALLDKLARALR